MNQIPYLPKFKKTIKCTRCTMKYDAKMGQCPHCKGVKDGRELEQLIEQQRMEMKAGAELGRVFIFIMVVIGFLLLLAQA